MQSNIDFSEIGGEDTPNNWRWRNNQQHQGGFDTNVYVFTQAYARDDGEIEVGIHPCYCDLFDFQRQTYEHLQF